MHISGRAIGSCPFRIRESWVSRGPIIFLADHTYEERNIFPVLAKKMPAFQEELHLLTQHQAISSGLNAMKKYLNECGDGERELRMEELKEILDGFGPGLWQHLDDEVHQLGAENMQKYWSLEEMKRMPM